jgi:uncharacterized protein (DUF1684 family)
MIGGRVWTWPASVRLWHTDDVVHSSARRLAAALCAAAVLSGCSSEPPDVAYAKRVAESRTRKDEFFRGGADSPIKSTDYDKFLPLHYFDIDPAYAAPATLKLLENRTKLQMPTSTGKIRDMERVGTLEFLLKGKPLKLTAFAEASESRISRLFVPFSDLTSGTETYQAGRYLDIDPESSGVYVVDFNQAYHPYCYYNAEFDCPFPPAENRLQTPIRAGERLRGADTLGPTR